MTKIRTIEQRKRLAHRRKPCWHPLDGLRGAALGFRKHAARALQGGGMWVLRYRVGGKYLEQAFAESDNAGMPPNGSTVLSFDQAVNRARGLYSELTSADALAERTRPYTVGDVCREYVKELEEIGGGWKEGQQRLEAFIIPELGDQVIEELKAEVIREWMRALEVRTRPSTSNWNPRSVSPFLGMQVGHNRAYPDAAASGEKGTSFRPPESEKLDLESMVRGYTINGAYPLRMEAEIGSIEAGKLADLLVIDDDLFQVDRNAIHRIKPAAIMMEGQWIHGEFGGPYE